MENKALDDAEDDEDFEYRAAGNVSWIIPFALGLVVGSILIILLLSWVVK